MQAVKPSRKLSAACAAVSYACVILAIYMEQPFWAGFNACMTIINLVAAYEPA